MTRSSRLRLGWRAIVRAVGGLVRRPKDLAHLEARSSSRFAEGGEGARARRLLPVTRTQHVLLGRLSRCIACGMCDARFDAYDAVDRKVLRGPSDLALGHARALAEVDALRAYLHNLRRGDLERLERVCPVGVPFAKLAVALEAMAEAAGPPAEAPEPRERRSTRPPPGPG